MSRFNDKLLQHFLNPKNVGKIDNADCYARVENPINGYTTDIYIKLENGKIIDAKFKTLGCTATIATASAATELIKEKTLDELIIRNDLHFFLMELIDSELGGVPEKNWHCLPTTVNGVITALYNYFKAKNDKKIEEKLRVILNEIEEFFEEKIK